MTKEEMDKLLATPRHLLGAIDRQRRFLLKRALVPRECIHPDCDRQLSQLDACEQGIEGYVVGNAVNENTFRCPGCGTPLAIIVPFVAGPGPGWHWGKARR